MDGQLAYAKRKINVTFNMASNFSAGTYNSSKIEGLRVSATISMSGAPSLATLQMRVWGLALSRMNDLTTITWLMNYNRNNTVTLEAGDDINGMTQVFTGTINTAFMEGANQPEVSFYVESQIGSAEMLKPGTPISTEGQTDVAQQMQTLAAQMGLGFKNNGVNVQLNQSYVPSTLMEQAHALADHANIEMTINPTTKTLIIYPKGGSSNAAGDSIPLVSADTGMHDYPSFNQSGLAVTTQFNPNLNVGGQVQIRSQITPINGTFTIQTLTHVLESELPGGKWISSFQAYNFIKAGTPSPGGS
jgi:hypothetical protein